MSTLTAQPVPPSPFSAPLIPDAAAPAWYAESRTRAWDAFSTLPMPGRKDENWRFANVSLLATDAFRKLPPGEVPAFEGLKETSARVVTVNDEVTAREGSDTVQVLGLTEALEVHGELLRPLLVSPDAGLGGAKFAALNHSQLTSATVIVVPAGAEISAPVEIVHWLTGDGSAGFPRTIIVAGENSRVVVVEHHLTADCKSAAFSCGAAQIVAGRGAAVSYIHLNRHNRASKTVHISTVQCAQDSQVKHATFNLGGGYVRSEALSRIAGKGSRSDMLSVSLASGEQEIDQRTLQDHLVSNGFSDLLYKNVLFDQAKTIFAGLIRVDDGAHYTDAYQKCRNLLLSDDCEANSMPGLEINADQVKCSHGSTSGRLSEEEVFYFQSRGIPRQAAEHMISLGFTMEVISRIENEAVEALVFREVEARFAALEK